MPVPQNNTRYLHFTDGEMGASNRDCSLPTVISLVSDTGLSTILCLSEYSLCITRSVHLPYKEKISQKDSYVHTI